MRYILATLVLCIGCGGSQKSEPSQETSQQAPKPVKAVEAIEHFNQKAEFLNAGIFFKGDANNNGVMDANEFVELDFYGKEDFIKDGAFTNEFLATYRMAKELPKPNTPEERMLRMELKQGALTLIQTDFHDVSKEERSFVLSMKKAGELIEDLYGKQVGLKTDVDSRLAASVLRRNWTHKCVAPDTENERNCSAIASGNEPTVGVYSPEIQKVEGFCDALKEHANAKELIAPFTVVEGTLEAPKAVGYNKKYKIESQAISEELQHAAKLATAMNEESLQRYLDAAAEGFLTNNWNAADEAWAQMNVHNSNWYVRVGPDEVYWDPCSYKAGYHLTFARIDKSSIEWQEKLKPLQQDMEKDLEKLSENAYAARTVSFHLPDFIAIILNAGDDRKPFGATIGQSLPNWGPVAAEGRGRTVAMTNLYGDPKSMKRARKRASTLFSEETMSYYAKDNVGGLLSTIVHEAMHNLGPSHEYAYKGKTAKEAFGGQIASMLEELKAQTGALYFLQMLQEKGVISQDLQKRSYVDSIAWGLGHISRGMYTADGKRRAYSQLAAIQLGYFLDAGAVEFDPEALAANGKDKGAFTVHLDKMADTSRQLMKEVLMVKTKNDVASAHDLIKRYVDGDVVPMETIKDRFLRFPKATFVYAATVE